MNGQNLEDLNEDEGGVLSPTLCRPPLTPLPGFVSADRFLTFNPSLTPSHPCTPPKQTQKHSTKVSTGTSGHSRTRAYGGTSRLGVSGEQSRRNSSGRCVSSSPVRVSWTRRRPQHSRKSRTKAWTRLPRRTVRAFLCALHPGVMTESALPQCRRWSIRESTRLQPSCSLSQKS